MLSRCLIVKVIRSMIRTMANAALQSRPQGKAKAATRVKRSGPTVAELRTQVALAKKGGERVDVGKLSHAERNKLLFGL